MRKIQLELSIEEANVILEALGQLPFARVFALIGRFQEQARAQLDAPDVQTNAAVAHPQHDA
ncbi:MAG TPA: hypothetical protein VHP33_13930 [Polyangiaceae bacterium]|nr:hypothetical protein [Polyangiaceae bacterium]